MNNKDTLIIRDLAEKVAEIAGLPVQKEKIRLWKALNGLKPARPMVMIDQLPWHELNAGGELTPGTADPFLRDLETRLLRILYRWKHFPADTVVEQEITVSKVIKNSWYGIDKDEDVSISDPKNDVMGHSYRDQLKTEEDLEKIRTPVVSLDAKATAEKEERSVEALGDHLKVRMQGLLPSCAPWDVISQWRGVEAVLYDLADRPEFMHKMADRLVTAYLAMLDSLQSQGLLGWGQGEIHCTGAWTDELPGPGFDPKRPRTSDLWTFGMAQIFGSVSPAMHDEFEIPYMKRIYSRFGLGYYGCCEPLDDRIGLIRKIPNVRKISMSPWTNQERGAESIGRDFVFSRKPSPALLAVPRFDPQAVRKDLEATIAACRGRGCPLEIILKDVSTVNYEPARLEEWNRIAMDLVTR